MAFVTLLVVAAAGVAAFLLCRHLMHVLADAGATRRKYRSTMEGLAARTFQAAQADRENARDSSAVAEATRELAQQAAEVQESLALERKLRRAIRSSVTPLPASSPHAEPEKSSASSVSA